MSKAKWGVHGRIEVPESLRADRGKGCAAAAAELSPRLRDKLSNGLWLGLSRYNLANDRLWDLIGRALRHPPIFVFAPRKTASSTIYYTLFHQYSRKVRHAHFYNADAFRKEWGKRFVLDQSSGNRKVITMVRDPVERNVSDFFWVRMLLKGSSEETWNVSLEELREEFLNLYDAHRLALEWFDAELQPNFGVDAYSKPFPESGYCVHTGQDLRVLILKMEMGDERMLAALRAFVGMPKLALLNTNYGSEYVYGKRYAEFKSRVKLPLEYLNMCLNSRYAKHFYTAAEREATLQKWAEAGNAPGH